MTEHHSHFKDFDSASAAEALGTEPRAHQDVAYGDGHVLAVGATELEIFPEAGVARVTMPDARIELFRVPTYTITGERVVFEQGDDDQRSRLQVRADGRVAFHPVLRAPGQLQEGEPTPAGRLDSFAVAGGSSAPIRRADGTETPEARAIPEEELTGRLGRDPWYNNVGDDHKAGFPLAVDEGQGQTTWHRVVAFGDLADEVRANHQTGNIRKGRTVKVTGEPVTHKEENGRGGVRTTTEFHATSITRMRNTTVPHPQGR